MRIPSPLAPIRAVVHTFERVWEEANDFMKIMYTVIAIALLVLGVMALLVGGGLRCVISS